VSRRRSPDAVVPVVELAATVEALGAVWCLQVLAEHAGPIEDALEVLHELQAAWGPGGELALLGDAPTGRPVPLSWETVLLLGTLTPCSAPPGGFELDVSHGTATRTGVLMIPTADEMHAAAVALVAQELEDAGCLAAQVTVGSRTAVVNEEEWRSYWRPRGTESSSLA